MSMAGIIRKLPEYANDIKLNLAALFIDEDCVLSKRHLFGVALAVGYALRHEQLLNSIRADAKLYLEDADATACKVSSIMMVMCNTFYIFQSILCDDEITNIPDALYKESVLKPQVSEEEMQMYCLAVSILNRCDHCVKQHTYSLLKEGLSKKAIRDIARVVAVLSAVADALEIERMRSYDFVVRDASID